MADWTSISLLTRGSATAIASNVRLDRLLAGVLVFVDTLKMKITRELKAPMHIHEFNLNEAADKIYAVGHDKLVRFDLQA